MGDCEEELKRLQSKLLDKDMQIKRLQKRLDVAVKEREATRRLLEAYAWKGYPSIIEAKLDGDSEES